MLLSSLPSSYDYLTTTIMYDKETLELENVRQMLLNNELMKKIDSTEEVSGLVVKGQRGDHRVGHPKGIQRFLAIFLATFVKKHGTSRRIV